MRSSSSLLLMILSCIIAGLVHGQPDTVLKGGSTNPITVKATTSHKYIQNNKPSKLAVLFDISTSYLASPESPEPHSAVRDPYELAIVLDRSGSMAGAKIEQSKAAMMSIVDQMIEGDIIHIIQYDYDVETLIRNGRFSSRIEILDRIKNIHSRGSTNLFGGLAEAYGVLKESITERQKNGDNSISHSRIFLFSDGLLNSGITNRKTILDRISQWKNALDITISTFGIGYDFDRDIMTSIAETAHGDFFFINSADSISKVIEIARKDAANIVATEAVLSVQTVDNADVEVTLNNLFERGRLDKTDARINQFNEIAINDLRAGGAKYVLVELMVNPKNNDGVEPRSIGVLEWKLSFNPKHEVLVKDMTQSISGKVDIEVTGEDNAILGTDDNKKEEVIVLWEMNEMVELDKQIVDDIADGNVEGAQRKRRRRNMKNKVLNEGSMFSSFFSSFGSSKLGSMVNSMQRRMKKDNIEDRMDRLGER
eukprot:113341_1